MDLHHLRLLRELGDRGSLAAVAQAMHITPSAVSQQLRTLQRSARVPLTERRGRRLVLTEAGRALAAAAIEISTALDRAARAVDDHLDDPAAPVTVAAFHSAALTFFGPLLGRSGLPPLRFADEDVPQAGFPALAADHDLVLAHRLAHSPPWPADRLAVVPLVREPLYVALPARHRLAAQSSLSTADVAAEPWIGVHEGFPLEGVLTAVAAAAGRPLDIVHRVNDFTVVAALVAAGGGLALLPGRTGRFDPAVTLRPLADLPVERHIDVLARPESLHRVAVRTVLAALRETATGPARPTGDSGA
ncbi:LysR family transcriptional regulator [Symbioplanes lichenis]|uniref:LysR family transcriptional regulator n=1 Tax=Symbioplanes lichenis TaxID=1629072 RepID=UPI002739ECA0|nr:LysR family transcriptional regulator [Actinoplanes lichenis]